MTEFVWCYSARRQCHLSVELCGAEQTAPWRLHWISSSTVTGSWHWQPRGYQLASNSLQMGTKCCIRAPKVQHANSLTPPPLCICDCCKDISFGIHHQYRPQSDASKNMEQVRCLFESCTAVMNSTGCTKLWTISLPVYQVSSDNSLLTHTHNMSCVYFEWEGLGCSMRINNKIIKCINMYIS